MAIRNAPTFSAGNIAAPNLSASVSGLNTVSDMITAEQDRQRQLRLDEELRLDRLRQQANADRTYAIQREGANREQAKFDLLNTQREALSQTMNNYSPYAAADRGTLDQEVMANADAFIPGNTPMVKGPDGMMPALDQEVFDRQSALQAEYENSTPSKEDAYAYLVKDAMGRGADANQAATLANTLTAGLVSKADQQKLDTATATDYNKRQELLYKEGKKDYRAQIKAQGKSGVSGKAIDALSKISPSQWIGGDRDDAYGKASAMSKALLAKGLRPIDVDKIIANGLKISSGKTDWWNDDVEFNGDRFDRYIRDTLQNPITSLDSSTTAYASDPTLARPMTAFDIENQRRISADSQDKEFMAGLLGSTPTIEPSPKVDKLKEAFVGNTVTNDMKQSVKDLPVKDDFVDAVKNSTFSDEEKAQILDVNSTKVEDEAKALNEEIDTMMDGYGDIEEASSTSPTTEEKFVKQEYTEENFPGTQGEYEEYIEAKEQGDPGVLQTLWRDLTEPGFFGKRIKKIEHEQGGQAAVIEMLFNSGPAAVTDVVGAGGLIKFLAKQGLSKTAAKQAAKEAKDISNDLSAAIGNRAKEKAAKKRLQELRSKYNLHGVGSRGRKVPTQWKTAD